MSGQANPRQGFNKRPRIYDPVNNDEDESEFMKNLTNDAMENDTDFSPQLSQDRPVPLAYGYYHHPENTQQEEFVPEEIQEPQQQQQENPQQDDEFDRIFKPIIDRYEEEEEEMRGDYFKKLNKHIIDPDYVHDRKFDESDDFSDEGAEEDSDAPFENEGIDYPDGECIDDDDFSDQPSDDSDVY
ncbi:hypothetical protein TVAG_490390 [Trichomonas vaginalis G3]|uniref:Uncharacterized protein n=1 Tax=Trichomonas vaginalis (strain ATCC PRA-98 / G3) TaxID=412133 RepID=A2F0X6_TRIV3|nr:hypothetical protein TVAGG3_0532510 [Trichomonas vaginalis G3]EAY01451.1 hypothetical protein TVAG_490390 [Trichomonas vaginalis G3]KAI5519256.1 hypothetical protein TVAGG3_0532510 [Trichomonas vaginalis G3]|eukprot:XP_001330264.1 hypothetical protein [Trichomonas vaginalis G3]